MTHLYVTYSETVWKQLNEYVFGLLLGKSVGKMMGKEGSNNASREDRIQEIRTRADGKLPKGSFTIF